MDETNQMNKLELSEPEMNEPEFNEKAELDRLQSAYKKIIKVLTPFTSLKSGSPDLLEKMQRALKGLPPGEILAATVNDLGRETKVFLERLRREWVHRFREIETRFIKQAREQGVPVQEQDRGWRVGKLEIQVKREQYQVQISYNHEVIIPWSVVRSESELGRLIDKANAGLENMALPEGWLGEIFWRAFQRWLGTSGERESRSYAPILDFYRQVRMELVESELREGKPDRKLRYADFPRWAFLYNVDRYRTISATLPPERRLGFESGSQREVAQGKGMTINGLDARGDYKKVCYVVSARP